MYFQGILNCNGVKTGTQNQVYFYFHKSICRECRGVREAPGAVAGLGTLTAFLFGGIPMSKIITTPAPAVLAADLEDKLIQATCKASLLIDVLSPAELPNEPGRDLDFLSEDSRFALVFNLADIENALRDAQELVHAVLKDHPANGENDG